MKPLQYLESGFQSFLSLMMMMMKPVIRRSKIKNLSIKFQKLLIIKLLEFYSF